MIYNVRKMTPALHINCFRRVSACSNAHPGVDYEHPPVFFFFFWSISKNHQKLAPTTISLMLGPEVPTQVYL